MINYGCRTKLAGKDFSVSGYALTRGRLPLALLEGLIEFSAERLGMDEGPGRHWRGHRVWFNRGSGLSMLERIRIESGLS